MRRRRKVALAATVVGLGSAGWRFAPQSIRRKALLIAAVARGETVAYRLSVLDGTVMLENGAVIVECQIVNSTLDEGGMTWP